jgi:hypothetical protein
MKRDVLTMLASLALLASVHAIDAPQARMDEKQRGFFNDYCVKCHGEKKQKGKLRLDDISFALDSIESADRWQKILNQINSGDMPPDEATQPERVAKTDFLEALSRTLVTARRTLGDVRGKITMRRLNRREYKNTIRDLLGVDLEVNELPADGGAGTFDTVGSSLFISSDQFEQYLALGGRALDEAFARSAPPSAQRLKERREVELHANAMVGGTYNGYYKGGYTVAKAYLDSDRSKPPSAFGKGIPDEKEATFRVREFERNAPSFERYLNDPLTKSGSLLTIFNMHPEEVITLPPDQPSGWLKTKHQVDTAPPGEYMLRFRIGAVKGTPAERHFVALGSRKEKDEFSLMQTFQITGATDEPQIIEAPVSITTDGPHTFVLREKRDVKQDREIFEAALKQTGFGPPPALWIDWVEWEGPMPTHLTAPAVQPIVFENTSGASERDYARAIIERFAMRAFRGKQPGKPFIDRLVRLFEGRVEAGDKFEEAIKLPLSVVLASPDFLYLQEPGEEDKPRGLTDLELATRLSYFLWSAPPDDELLALARNNTLRQPTVLARQVDRMIASENSSAFVAGFVSQWLNMERLDFFQFDTKQFRDFDDSAKAAARREVYETFAHLMRDGDSLSRLLKSDAVFINGLLANYYGIEGVTGDEFRKVKLPPGSPRGGLLGMAAILAMGSNGQVSSPVERGKWVLKYLLNDPPPPAPKNVPQITRLEGKLLTTRERLAAHQEQPQCAQCHRKIDPIGFGLENFDAAGKWRIEDGYEKKGVGKKTWVIDPGGAFYKGPAFKDYFELRELIAAQPQKFARGFTEALIEYALGRPFGFVDEDLASDVVRRGQEKDFAIREFVQSLVASKAFQTK